MKKSIFVVSFIILSLLFSYSFVYAENANNGAIQNGIENVQNAAENAGNTVQNAVDNIGNGMNNVTENAGNDMNNAAGDAGNEIKNSADKTGNNMRNAGNTAFTATRTATEDTTNNTGNQGWMNRDMWTWIVVGIITVVIIALIWYYASRSNH